MYLQISICELLFKSENLAITNSLVCQWFFKQLWTIRLEITDSIKVNRHVFTKMYKCPNANVAARQVGRVNCSVFFKDLAHGKKEFKNQGFVFSEKKKNNNKSWKIGPFGPDFLRFGGKKERKNLFFINIQNLGKKEVKKNRSLRGRLFFLLFFSNRSKKTLTHSTTTIRLPTRTVEGKIHFHILAPSSLYMTL